MAEKPRAAVSPANGNGEHIVVADDNEAVRETITTLLTARGYRVTCCADRIEALKHFSARPRGFDLVITDVDMPNIGGGLLSRVLLQLRPDVKITRDQRARCEGARHHGGENSRDRQRREGRLSDFAVVEGRNFPRREARLSTSRGSDAAMPRREGAGPGFCVPISATTVRGETGALRPRRETDP